MRNWKKSFRKLPATYLSKIESTATGNIKVLSGKLLNSDELLSDEYVHLGFTAEKLQVGIKWDVLPPQTVGTASKRNVAGREIIRKDLPKYKKYIYQDIPIYGDGARNGWTTATIPREVYERDSIPPYLFGIEIRIAEQQADGRFGIVFSIDEILDVSTPSFASDVLFAVNLLQENVGTSGIVDAENPEFVFTSKIDWDFFPPGNIDELAHIIVGDRDGKPRPDLDTVKERLSLFEQFRPNEYLRGMGGNDEYIGAKYADDLVVFENMKYGNALYVLYSNWAELSQRPRSELLRSKTSQFDRIVHLEGWENIFATLMQNELQQRGIRIRIGRNRRRGR